jgi:colicin import membrane protein
MAATAGTLTKHERPRQPRRTKGKLPALVLAIVVQLGFLAVLVFSVQWQSRKPEPITAELYAPPVKAPVVEAPPPPPKAEPEPAPPPPKPAPVVEKPDPRAAEIALKAKQEQERKQREEAARQAREKEAKEAEDKRRLEEKQKAERQQKEMAAMRAQLDREVQQRAQAERDQQARVAAEASARSRSEADWIRRIQAKVKGNVIVPSELAGNPEAIFEVVQLPTGEIIEATLRKSSGSRAYDDAVQRAILKSSPLPRPDKPELFQRNLTLKFRPQD